MKKDRNSLAAVFLYGFFAVYLFLLLYVLLLSRWSFSPDRMAFRSINLVPFHSIWWYLSGQAAVSGSLAFDNIFWNIAMFLPLGLYLPVIFPGKPLRSCFMGMVLFSLAAEILQWILGVGATDIDDIILNSLGGLIGLVGYRILLALLKQEHRVRRLITAASVVVGAPVLFIAVGVYLANR